MIIITIIFIIKCGKAKFISLDTCCYVPIPVAARSSTCVCGRSLAGIGYLNPAGGVGFCVLSSRGLCDEPITRPEESYRV